MPNPLYEMLNGGNGQNLNAMPQNQMNDPMSMLRSNPGAMIRQAGFQVPDEIVNNPQSVVTYLIQTGQVNNPLLQRIRPMLNQVMGR